MFERILIPLDGSQASSEILVDVSRLLLRQGAQVELYTAVVPIAESWRERRPDHPDDEARHPDLRIEDARRHLRRWQEELSSQGVTVTTEVELGDPAERILRRIERTGPSLVAMATHGRGGALGWLRGSVAQRVLREGTAPLLLINAGVEGAEERQGFRTILIPLDGSERSEAVLPLAAAMARLFQASVVLQHVLVEEGPEARAHAREVLERVAADFAEDGIPARIRVDGGAPAERILAALAEEDADLLAMTTHGRGGPARWFTGSVTEKVLRRCSRPLLIERTRPDEE